jgi:hypothetical protein
MLTNLKGLRTVPTRAQSEEILSLCEKAGYKIQRNTTDIHYIHFQNRASELKCFANDKYTFDDNFKHGGKEYEDSIVSAESVIDFLRPKKETVRSNGFTSSLQIYIPIHSQSESLDVQKKLVELGYHNVGGRIYLDLIETNQPDPCLTLWGNGDITTARVSEVQQKYSYCYIGDVKPFVKATSCPVRAMLNDKLGYELTDDIYPIYEGKIHQLRVLGMSNEDIFQDILKSWGKDKVKDMLRRQKRFEANFQSIYTLYESSIELALERGLPPIRIVSQIIKIENQFKEKYHTFEIIKGNYGFHINNQDELHLHKNGTMSGMCTSNYPPKRKEFSKEEMTGWYDTWKEAYDCIKKYFPECEIKNCKDELKSAQMTFYINSKFSDRTGYFITRSKSEYLYSDGTFNYNFEHKESRTGWYDTAQKARETIFKYFPLAQIEFQYS